MQSEGIGGHFTHLVCPAARVCSIPGGGRQIGFGVADEKVLAVPLGDPYSEGLSDLQDIAAHYLREIEHFFQVYKDLEGTRTETRGFEGAAAAKEAVARAIELYDSKFGGHR